MPARGPIAYAVRLAALALAPVAALALAACGSTTYDDPGGQQTTAVRPLTRQPVAADGALECSSALEDDPGTTVPDKPQGVDGAARLLPQREPVSLVVCGYPVGGVTTGPAPTAPFPLRTRTVAIGQQRAEVVETMTWAPRSDLKPRACTSMAGGETAYLVGVAYGDAIVWLAAKADADACSTATNGDFVPGGPFGLVLAEAFGRKQRPTVADESCRVRSWGRLGDDRLLAPDGGPTVVICRQSVDGTSHATALDAGRSAEVAAALRALGTRSTGRTCEGSGTASDHRFSLVYAAGRAAPSAHPSSTTERGVRSRTQR